MRIVILNPCTQTGARPKSSRKVPICWCSSKECTIHKGWYGIDQWNEMNPKSEEQDKK